MKNKLNLGGQAVIEGVLMKSPEKYAISVRKPDKKIITKIVETKEKSGVYNIPFIRGTFRLIDTMAIGINALNYSMNLTLEKEQKISKKEMAFTVALSILMTIGLFYVIPLIFARMFTQRSLMFNIADGVLRLGIFIAYIVVISFMQDVKRLFEYHGAEHKTVSCYENGEKLTVKNVKKYSTAHPRCGTTFILLVFVFSIILFTLVPATSLIARLLLRIGFLPIIAGISYETLRLAGNYPDKMIVKVISAPGLALQKLTTREPDDHQIEVSICALKAALPSAS